MTPVTFTVWGIAEPKGSTRAFIRGGRAVVTSDNRSLAKWESAVRFAAAEIVRASDHHLFSGAVAVRVLFHVPRPPSVSERKRRFPTTKPDLTKLARGAEDPLTGLVWNDDAQVVVWETAKLYTTGPARAVFTITPVWTDLDLPTFARGDQ